MPKIYAVRDRLIDYYMTPFCAESDRQVMASLAQTINNPENMNAIAQSPSHFEIWRLGEVNEDTGHITATREFLGTADSVVRPGLRRTGEPGIGPGPGAAGGREIEATSPRGHARADSGVLKGQVEANPEPPQRTGQTA